MRNASLADCADAEREREKLAVWLTDTAGREWAAQQRLAEAATARRRTRAGTPRRTTPVSRTFFEGFLHTRIRSSLPISGNDRSCSS